MGFRLSVCDVVSLAMFARAIRGEDSVWTSRKNRGVVDSASSFKPNPKQIHQGFAERRIKQTSVLGFKLVLIQAVTKTPDNQRSQ